MSGRPAPPRLARVLLHLRFRGETREVVEGDLHEYFARDLAAGRSASAARRRYWSMALASVASARVPARWRGRAAADAGTEPSVRGALASLAGTFGHDVRLGVRRLGANPGFTLTAILTLALAIGATVALFTALRRVVLAPLPFADGDRLVLLWRASANGRFMLTPSAGDVERWRRLDGVFEWIETYATESPVLLGHGEPVALSAGVLPAPLIAQLGEPPRLGRPFGPADALPEAEPIALLGQSLWHDRFAGDPAVIGRPIRLGDAFHRIVGVMPASFRLPGVDHDLWLPRRGDPPDRGASALALLREGVDLDTARAALRQVPVGEDVSVGAWFGQLMTPGDMFGLTTRRTLELLSGAVGLLLLIACVNVAGLMLSRHRRRQRELALRLSLGASRVRLVRLLMIESALVAAAGGLAGFGAARLGLQAIAAVRPASLTAIDGLRLDGPALAFAMLVTAAAGLLFGVVPAVRASRWNVARELAAGGRGATGDGLASRGALGAVQLAMALVLLAGTLLLTRSVARLGAVDPGFEPDGLVSLQLSLDGARYDEPEARRQFVEQLDRAMREMRGVVGVGRGSGLPPEMGIVFGAPELEAGPAAPGDAELFGGGWASPGYFATLGVPVVEGRAFTDDDARSGAAVTVISQGLARRLGGGRTLVGERLRMSDSADFATIVGVVGDVRANGLRGEEGEQVYRPLPATTPRAMTFAVRTSTEPAAMVDALEARVWTIDPDLPITSARPVRDVMWTQAASTRFAMTLLGAFAVVGLGLAAVGVFGTLTLVVTQRRREVAVRLSLGATPGRVVGMVARYVAAIVAGGLALGFGAAWLLSPYIESLLFDVPPLDAVSLALALSAVIAAALLATVAPLRRMLGVEPAEALRAD